MILNRVMLSDTGYKKKTTKPTNSHYLMLRFVTILSQNPLNNFTKLPSTSSF